MNGPVHRRPRSGLLQFGDQMPLPPVYRGRDSFWPAGPPADPVQRYRDQPGHLADIPEGDKVVLELKAVECLTPLHGVQLLTYLRVSPCRFGLLINFDTGSPTDRPSPRSLGAHPESDRKRRKRIFAVTHDSPVPRPGIIARTSRRRESSWWSVTPPGSFTHARVDLRGRGPNRSASGSLAFSVSLK